MVLDGVSVDDRVVREIAAVVGKPLAQKLEQALFFSAEVVALTRTEKDAVLAALDQCHGNTRRFESFSWQAQVGRRGDRDRPRGR